MGDGNQRTLDGLNAPLPAIEEGDPRRSLHRPADFAQFQDGDRRPGRYISDGGAAGTEELGWITRMSTSSQSDVAANTVAVQQSGRGNSVFARLALTTLYHACAVFVGLALLVILFKLRVFHNIDVLFYRGVVLVGVAGILTFVGFMYVSRWCRVDLSAAVTAAVLSMSINLTFLVIFPVTIDRSISVFLLAYMDQHPDRAFTPAQLRSAVAEIYVSQYQQIDRRVDEQLISRNVHRLGGAYQISAQGRAFITFARAIAWMFDTDPRLISGETKTEK